MDRDVLVNEFEDVKKDAERLIEVLAEHNLTVIDAFFAQWNQSEVDYRLFLVISETETIGTIAVYLKLRVAFEICQPELIQYDDIKAVDRTHQYEVARLAAFNLYHEQGSQSPKYRRLGKAKHMILSTAMGPINCYSIMPLEQLAASSVAQ
jgi:hypothetical protein